MKTRKKLACGRREAARAHDRGLKAYETFIARCGFPRRPSLPSIARQKKR